MGKRSALVAVVIVLAAALGFGAIAWNNGHKQPGRASAVATDSFSNSADKPAAGSPKDGRTTDKPGMKAMEQGANPKKSDQQQKAAKQAKAMVKQHENTFKLMRAAFLIAGLDKSGDNGLKPAQAKQALGILEPLRSKPKLTEEEAGKALQGLSKVLTTDQLKAMEEKRRKIQSAQRQNLMQHQGPAGQRPMQGAPGQRPPQFMPPSGPNGAHPKMMPGTPPMGRQQPGKPGERRVARSLSPEELKNFNPFYSKPVDDNPILQMQVKLMDRLFQTLEKAAGK